MSRQTSHLDKARLNNLADEIWKSAERLRGKFKAHEYQVVVLPIITIRRLECVLIQWREEKAAEIRSKRKSISDDELEKLVKGLELNPKQSPGFSNSTNWTLRKIYEEDHTLLEKNFRAYLNGFSPKVQEVLDAFDYRAVISKMVKNARLAPILNQYSQLAIGPEKLSSLEMGYIYEELLRRFSEAHAEAAGDHFTPREIIRLMVELLDIPIPTRHTSLYDPACGTYGMLYVAKEHLLDKATTAEERERVHKFLTLHGTELMAETYAIAQSEALIRGETQATVCWGNSLIPHDPQSKEPGDQFPESLFSFDFMLSNPPFGVKWGGKDGYQDLVEKLRKTRYTAGMPSIDDGSLLFLQTLLAKMKPVEQGGSKIAIIFNGSPLSNGDCGEGESEIRRWILENDWLDAIVMLPNELFYNTGIYTYIWLLRNDREQIGRDGRVMIIDGRQQYEKEPKSFGSKRNRIVERHREWIEKRYRDGWKKGFTDPDVRFFKKADFAFHKVQVVFWQTDESDRPAIITEPFPVQFKAANVKSKQDFYDSEMTLHIRVTSPKSGKVHAFDLTLGPDDSFVELYKKDIAKRFGKEMGKLTAATLDKLDTEVSYTHRHYIKDDEYIPFDPTGKPEKYIPAFLEREIEKTIVRWEDRPQLGYEILPNKYFYRYTPPPAADDLLKQFWVLEKEAKELLMEGARVLTRGLNPKTEMKESGVDWLGPIPKHWEIRRIKDIVDARSGEGITSHDIAPEGDYPVYGGNGLRGFTETYTHEGSFVLIGRQGALCGNINYAQGRFFASEHAVVCSPRVKLETRWFGELLKAMNLNQYSNAAAQPGLSVDRIKRLKIPVPPRSEREAIQDHLEMLTTRVSAVLVNLSNQVEALSKHQSSLIHECVTGKRRISDADVAKVEAHV